MAFPVKDWRDLPEEETPIDAAALEDMESRLAAYTDAGLAGVNAPLVAALPSTPADGAQVFFQDAGMATLGIAWHLRYRAGATGRKWEFVGGGALYLSDAGPYTSGSPSYVFAGSGQVLVPLAGDYHVTFACRLGSASSSGVHAIYGALAVNAATSRLEASQLGTSAVSVTDRLAYGLGPAIVTLAAGDTLRPQVKTTGGNVTTLQDIDITARPIRVG